MPANGKRKELSKLTVYFFIPNIIDYFRIILYIIAWIIIDKNPVLFVTIYSASAFLDGLDGFVARKLNQESELGVFLDVLADIFGRGIIWCYVSKYGYFFPALEWVVYTANTTTSRSQNWKDSFDNAPTYVKAVMANGFKTLLGTFVILGLHAFPVVLYLSQHRVLHFMPIQLMGFITIFLGLGRLACLTVEMWCVVNYFNYLVDKTIKNS